ncbi:MAG TPA: hypothetical protein VLN49_03515 [Gemmatimonadaceae bacterium]|nr:hypothetical protein [Gemmatimonadaceae bacterium]
MHFTHLLVVITSTLGVLSPGTRHTAPANALPNPCGLLTSAQISSVVGSTFGASQAISTTGCQWAASKQGDTPGAIVTLVVQDAKVWDRATAPLAGVTRVPESGIGDAAMYTIAGPLASLGVRKGAVTVIIRMYGVHPLDKAKAMEKALAADAIAKL